MSEFLVIHYKPMLSDGLQNNVHYWALGGDQHPSITLGHGSLQELKPIARGKKVSILIDANLTSLKVLNIPSKNRSKQLQAIPFAMEDLLAEDIDDTHFALGKPDGDKLPVIAIKRTLLQQILDTFLQQEIHIDCICADSIPLPATLTQWSILLDNERALIKTNEHQALTCERDNLQLFLQALLEQEPQPESIDLFYQAEDSEALSILSSTDITINAHHFKNHSLEIFLKHMDRAASFNLLQGEFMVKRDDNSWILPWKSVAGFFAIWIALQLSSAVFNSAQLAEKNLSLSKKIETEFRRAMPEARRMTNIQKRVERRLKDLRSGGQAEKQNGFLQILSKASSALKNNNELSINAAVYRNNYIDVDLSAKSLQAIEKTKSALDALPGIKTVLSTTVEKNNVSARLRLEAKG